jgi:hypothetical protein
MARCRVPALPSQIAILALQALVSRDLWRGEGRFAQRMPPFGRAMRWFSIVYFTGMFVRYPLTMWLLPERRWFHGTIPIFFHWILAAYLFLWSRFLEGRR